MPPIPAHRTRNTANESKKEKSGIPLKESSKTITKRQTKLPAAISRLKTSTAEAAAAGSSSKKVTSEHPNGLVYYT